MPTKIVLTKLLVALSLFLPLLPMSGQAGEARLSAPPVQQAALAKININSADAETIEQGLSGVGAVKAKAIVAYRQANGRFDTVDELQEVPGIGSAILERNRHKLGL